MKKVRESRAPGKREPGNGNSRRDHQLWLRVIGRHGIGNENANGSMLLDLCVKYSLVITNTVFQLVREIVLEKWQEVDFNHSKLGKLL